MKNCKCHRRKKVFEGLQFVVNLPTNVPCNERLVLKRKITSANGVVSYILTRKTNFVIRDINDNSQSYHALIAEKYGVPSVTANFVDACLEEGRLVDFKLYSLKDERQEAESNLATGTLYANSEAKLQPCHVRLAQTTLWTYKSKEGPTFHTCPYVVVKAVLLKGTQKQKGHPFCIIEIHASLDDTYMKETNIKFCVFTHHGILPNSLDVTKYGTKSCRFLEASGDAVSIFEQLHKLYTSAQYSMVPCITFPNFKGLGSDSFNIKDWSLTSSLVEPEVAQFVADIWTEFIYMLESTLSVQLTNVQESQVSSGETLLLEISKALLINDTRQAEQLSHEFFDALPHRCRYSITNWNSLTFEYNMCRLVKDLLLLQESIPLSDQNKSEWQYSSLHCDIQALERTSSEYRKVTSLMLETMDDLSVNICNIFCLNRACENEDFIYNIGNRKLLLHGSKVEDVVGVLSRGFLICRNSYQKNLNMECDSILGHGLYFFDNLKAAIKNTEPGKTNGKCIVLISEVAIGKCFTTFSNKQQLLCSPEGYNSVCGVKAFESEMTSDFNDNTYVIYEVNQQRLKYVVEFYLTGDTARVETNPPMVENNLLGTVPSVVIEARNEFGEPFSSSSFDLQQFLAVNDGSIVPEPVGLQSKTHVPIPLKSVHVRVKLIDLAAEVVLMQEYHNDSSNNIEARYVFPLNDKVAVCGFEAYSNGKHFVGRVEEKTEARKEYKQAVDTGKQAQLMDEEAPGVFKVSIGNLQPNSTVLVKIRYVAELDLAGEMISFSLPSLASSVHSEDMWNTQNIDTSLQIFVEMPFDIRTIMSPTHTIRVKKTLTKAVLTSSDANVNISKSFQLLIGLSEIHVPRMWVENHPEMDSSACMLTFYPEFISDSKDNIEVILALDASNSMAGKSFATAQQLAILCLHYLPPKAKFNVLMFGTIYHEVFPTSRPKSLEDIFTAQKYILKSQPKLGSSRVDHFLQSYFTLIPHECTLRNIFIITDGHVQLVDRTINIIPQYANCARIFSLGVGPFVNSHILSQLSNLGSGTYQHFDEARKSQWATKILDQLQKAEAPVLTDVSVEWQQFNDRDIVLQAPQSINSVFSGCRLTVYGFVPNCNLGTLKGCINGHEVKTTVFTPELAESVGTILHSLTTKAIVCDWEGGMFNSDRAVHEVQKRQLKAKIVELSKQFNIITPFTSFVAVEDGDSKEIESFKSQPSITEFVQAEHVQLEHAEHAQHVQHARL